MLDGEDCVCDRVQRRQHMHALTARRRVDTQPFKTPNNPPERGKHDRGRIHKEDGTLAGLGFS